MVILSIIRIDIEENYLYQNWCLETHTVQLVSKKLWVWKALFCYWLALHHPITTQPHLLSCYIINFSHHILSYFLQTIDHLVHFLQNMFHLIHFLQTIVLLIHFLYHSPSHSNSSYRILSNSAALSKIFFPVCF